jgi:1-acyl-sn-glycerol-3-phosphate acyltransferase
MTYRVVRAIVVVFVRVLWRLRVTGRELLPSGPFVLVANHESVLDAFIVGAAIPRSVHFLGKDDLWRNRPVGLLLSSLGAIPVGRGRGDSEAIRLTVEALRKGEIVGVFPQGTVLGGDARVWHRGAARMAISAGVPIVPICIVDAERALRPVRRRLGFPIVRVVIGRPIEVERAQPTIAAAGELTDRVRREVEALQREYGSPIPAPGR